MATDALSPEAGGLAGSGGEEAAPATLTPALVDLTSVGRELEKLVPHWLGLVPEASEDSQPPKPPAFTQEAVSTLRDLLYTGSLSGGPFGQTTGGASRTRERAFYDCLLAWGARLVPAAELLSYQQIENFARRDVLRSIPSRKAMLTSINRNRSRDEKRRAQADEAARAFLEARTADATISLIKSLPSNVRSLAPPIDSIGTVGTITADEQPVATAAAPAAAASERPPVSYTQLPPLPQAAVLEA